MRHCVRRDPSGPQVAQCLCPCRSEGRTQFCVLPERRLKKSESKITGSNTHQETLHHPHVQSVSSQDASHHSVSRQKKSTLASVTTENPYF